MSIILVVFAFVIISMTGLLFLNHLLSSKRNESMFNIGNPEKKNFELNELTI